MDEKSNPYVLGYMVAQLPERAAKGDPLFLPLHFQFSTTPCRDKNDLVNRDLATLNFCMVTSPDAEEDYISVERNTNAGILSRPFNEITKRGAVADGTLGISRNAFVREYIMKKIVPIFILPRLPFKGIQVDEWTERTTFVGKNDFHRVDTYSYAPSVTTMDFSKRRSTYSVQNDIRVTWTSTLLMDPAAVEADDGKRCTSLLQCLVLGFLHFCPQ
jgi:hypothetical protein